jgi:hypothetical protein
MRRLVEITTAPKPTVRLFLACGLRFKVKNDEDPTKTVTSIAEPQVPDRTSEEQL